jgi:IS5 family transposase
MLSNRRAGIEPIIGQTKQGGQLGKSRMKNDRNTESSSYGAVLGFNLRQILRAVINKV